MSARESILGRIRAAAAISGLPDAAADPAARQARVDGRLAAKSQSAPVPKFARLEGRERVERFCAQLQALSASFSHLPSLQALPAALSEALRARNLPAAIRMGAEPDLAALDWAAPGAGIEVSQGPGRLEEPATLSRAALAVAETGQLMLLSGPDNPVTLTFLGDSHFVVLKTSEIESGFEGAWARLRERGYDPRTVNLVAGPSRTADIAATLELGAHGPVALHVFLIDDV